MSRQIKPLDVSFVGCGTPYIRGPQEACVLLGQGLLHQGVLAREMQEPQRVGGRQGGMRLVIGHGAVNRSPCGRATNPI